MDPVRKILAPLAALLIVAAMPLILVATPAHAQTRVTVLYDAFGADGEMTRDWGFAALIEHDGRRILFDTGNDGDILARNLDAAGIDITGIDFAVISHRHGDHIGGLAHVLSRHPELTVYAPRENFSIFGMEADSAFLEGDPSLPDRLRYFDGHLPDTLRFGSAWPDGDFRWIGETTEIAPGVHLLFGHGDWGVDLDVKELSLLLETGDGPLLVVGCSHPTIEAIVETATETLGEPIDTVIGGFHLLPTTREEARRIALALRDEWGVRRIAPGHCTGEHAIAILRDVYGPGFVETGVGAVIAEGRRQ